MSKFYTNGLAHIGIPVSNIIKSIEFYTGLGFSKRYQPEGTKCAFMENGELLLELYEEDTVANQTGAINHIALNSDNLIQAYKNAVDNGYKIVSKGIEHLPYWSTGVSYFIILGLDNERIEFTQKGKHNV